MLEARKTVLTSDAIFLDALIPDLKADDPVSYDVAGNSVGMRPKWGNGPCVPMSGGPDTRVEAIEQ